MLGRTVSELGQGLILAAWRYFELVEQLEESSVSGVMAGVSFRQLTLGLKTLTISIQILCDGGI